MPVLSRPRGGKRCTSRAGRGLLASAAVVVAAVLATAVPAVTGGASTAAAAESDDMPFAGPVTIALHDGTDRYITYGAGSGVPYSIHGSGNDVGLSSTVDGHAMPGNAGAWTDGTAIWAPGAWYQVKSGVGRYYLFFTATSSNDADRKCIGVASSTSAVSGFRSQSAPLVCPTKGERWALDADIVQGPEGAIWMVWRDGERAEGPESAISVAQLKFADNGTVALNTDPKVIMRSDALTWMDYKTSGNGVTVMENPSAYYNAATGDWYLFYSGNSWPTNYYATGVASCGATIDGGLCTPIPGPNKAYFAYTGPLATYPSDMRVKGLPGNHRGPGALQAFDARDGRPWVSWNYLTGDSGTGRRSTIGRLAISGSGTSASFTVTQ